MAQLLLSSTLTLIPDRLRGRLQKLSGPQENLAERWRLIRKHIEIEDPQPHNRPDNSQRYLGCLHHKREVDLTWQGRNFTEDADATEKQTKTTVSEVRHDMGFFWRATCETYEELTGVDVYKLPDVKTPFPAER